MSKKKKLSNQTIKNLIREKMILQNFKATPTDIAKFQDLANKYARGNVSAWLRHAGLNYRPKKSEVLNEKA